MASPVLAIIGGSGLDDFDMLDNCRILTRQTPYGPHSTPVLRGNLSDKHAVRHRGDASSGSEIIFLPRHGGDHQTPPHLVNYRANIWALRQWGIERVLSCNVVGGISTTMSPGIFVVPDQIIDYTHSRQHTFADGIHQGLQHIDFAQPYSHILRRRLIAYLSRCDLPYQSQAVYACTQGPRLETAAEVKKLGRDGCDIVGMTAMPEAALAREVGIDYVGLSLVVNWAAGIETHSPPLDAIAENIAVGMTRLKALLPGLVQSLNSPSYFPHR